MYTGMYKYRGRHGCREWPYRATERAVRYWRLIRQRLVSSGCETGRKDGGKGQRLISFLYYFYLAGATGQTDQDLQIK